MGRWAASAFDSCECIPAQSWVASPLVAKLARAGGLTHAEARVAALLQMGLSNKDAAKAAGLKEQSVSTYAKRALSKLNVTSRAEMAQMLTWQAAGGKLQ